MAGIRKNAVKQGKDTYFMLTDFSDKYSVVEEVLDEFIRKWFRNADKKLELFFEEEKVEEMKYLHEMKKIINSLYEDPNLKCEISLQCGNRKMIKHHLADAKHLIINRNDSTILVMDYAKKYGTDIEVISGVDVPVFN